jgi:hypothetical protein
VLGRMRALKVAAATVGALMSGGAAWAASNAVGMPVGQVHAADVTDSSTSSTDVTDTTVSDTSTTATTDTTVAETSTTVATVDDTTTTTVDGDTSPTSVPGATDTTVPQQCKPGYGYGDTNHCHSGPPGQNEQQNTHAGRHSG